MTNILSEWAAHTLFVLRLLDFAKARNYYGSREQWGNRDDTPIEKRSTPGQDRGSSA